MILEDFALPDREEADYLLAGLARLMALRGSERFVAAPIVLPEPEYFPDPMAPRAEGVARLILRLMTYAGLEPSKVEIEIAENAPAHAGFVEKDDEPTRHAAAWFIDVDDGVYHFGVRDSELRDEEGLIGILAHEVAHAYRAYHRLNATDSAIEEQLTDITTVYLGFGVFTLASSFQFKTGHYSATGERLLYERQSRGYLRPGQLAYLLAAQLVVRERREKLLPSVRSALSANHMHALDAAREQLQGNRLALLANLGVPPEEQWPPVARLSDVLRPLPPTKIQMKDTAADMRLRAKNERLAFRVAGNSAKFGLSAGLVMGFGTALSFGFERWFWPHVLLSGLAGWFLGRRRSSPWCSACEHTVRPGSARCKFCSLPLVGDIDSPLDRIAAEERYRSANEPASTAETKQSSTTVRAEAIEGVSCPACAWQPTNADRWECDCGYLWNTFDTRGLCPSCAKQWAETHCTHCGTTSPHDEWYS